MNILAFDSSSQNFSIAVLKDGKVRRYRNFRLGKLLSSSIIEHIQSILSLSGLKFQDVDAFAIGLGPGSFTSLRVGIATVKGWAFVTKKPVVGIGSMDVIAKGVKNASQICVMNDARRNLVYACCYEKKGCLKRIGEYRLTSIQDVLKGLSGDVLFVGDAIHICSDVIQQWQKKRGNSALYADEKLRFPQAKCLGELAIEQLSQNNMVDPAQLLPIYLYPEDCQITKS